MCGSFAHNKRTCEKNPNRGKKQNASYASAAKRARKKQQKDLENNTQVPHPGKEDKEASRTYSSKANISARTASQPVGRGTQRSHNRAGSSSQPAPRVQAHSKCQVITGCNGFSLGNIECLALLLNLCAFCSCEN